MGYRPAIVLIAAAAVLSGCAGQSRVTQNPVWVSKGINGLQQSRCDCGGIVDKKSFKHDRASLLKAQQRAHKARAKADRAEARARALNSTSSDGRE